MAAWHTRSDKAEITEFQKEKQTYLSLIQTAVIVLKLVVLIYLKE